MVRETLPSDAETEYTDGGLNTDFSGWDEVGELVQHQQRSYAQPVRRAQSVRFSEDDVVHQSARPLSPMDVDEEQTPQRHSSAPRLPSTPSTSSRRKAGASTPDGNKAQRPFLTTPRSPKTPVRRSNTASHSAIRPSTLPRVIKKDASSSSIGSGTSTETSLTASQSGGSQTQLVPTQKSSQLSPPTNTGTSSLTRRASDIDEMTGALSPSKRGRVGPNCSESAPTAAAGTTSSSRTVSARALFRSSTEPMLRMGSRNGTNVGHATNTRSMKPPSEIPTQRRVASSLLSGKPLYNNEPSLHCDLPELGTKLKLHEIVHDKVIVKYLDDLKVPWGAQLMLAHYCTHSDPPQSLKALSQEKLKTLTGTNVEAAPKVNKTFLSTGKSSTDDPAVKDPNAGLKEIWAEYDREQSAIVEHRGRGLGLRGEHGGVANWYGGNIQQIGRLDENEGKIRIRIEKPEMTRSNAFARFLGSRRMLILKIDKRLRASERLRSFLAQRFILLGRVYVPFVVKEGKVYLMETNQNHERVPDQEFHGDHHRLSLRGFIMAVNPPDTNAKQGMAKYVARFLLGLSTSIPVIKFPDHERRLRSIADVCSSLCCPADGENVPPQHDHQKGSPAAELCMTDGAGFICSNALDEIARLQGRPPGSITAIQARIMGSKGMWSLNPNTAQSNKDFTIWIRDSQRKINLSPVVGAYPMHRILNLVAVDRVTTPSRLNRMSIVNLHHNGVPDHVLRQRMQESLESSLLPLLQWSGDEWRLKIAQAVDRAGRVSFIKAQRRVQGKARAVGLAGRFDDIADDSDEEDDDDDIDPENEPGRKAFSGAPLSVYESAIELLRAGFEPGSSKILMDSLTKIAENLLNKLVREYRITIPDSAEGFGVPDPFNTLEEGQIFFRPKGDEVILGDVLIYRNPCRLPSDVRKVKAVNDLKFHGLPNAIYLPIKGRNSLASESGGGDMDGDTFSVIWDEELVKNFEPKEVCTIPETFLKDNFTRDEESVESFVTRVRGMEDQKEAQAVFQNALFSGLMNPLVGRYSKYHDIAVYIYGYDHPETIRLAHIFAILLDSQKSGYRLKKEILTKDSKKYDSYSVPEYMMKKDDSGGGEGYQPKRGDNLGEFILDKLLRSGQDLQKKWMKELKERFPESTFEVEDQELTLPYREAIEDAVHYLRTIGSSSWREDLNLIQDAVCRVKDNFWPPPKKIAGKPNWDEAAKALAAELKDLGPNLQTMKISKAKTVMASYAYQKYFGARSYKFVFAVAWMELCRIKAAAGGHAAIRQDFANGMAVSSTYMRALEAATA